ncbi:MAG: glycosyltransferase family 1 protein [Phycisphaeraceae bacterium]|nr:glycosyltransferase family 1 protein [Phycisphaeraceae bacterium]
MRAQRWDEAAAHLAPLAEDDPAAARQLCLCRNLQALRKSRPALYKAVLRPARRAYQIVPLPSGASTLAWQDAQGGTRLMSPDGPDDPAAVLKALGKEYQNGRPLTLLGLGDGHLLQTLSRHPPKLFMDQEQAVLVFEPDPGLIMACLLIHDWSGPDSPLLAGRFSWFVGPDWKEQFEGQFINDPWMAPPTALVYTASDRQPDSLGDFEGWLKDFNDRITSFQRDLRDRLRARYSRVTPGALAATMAGRGPRPPRGLLVTSRFTTVLQYAMRDARAALERLGWETRLLIEPSPHHSTTHATIRRHLVDFEPDVVLAIDHLRHEEAELYPQGLLHVCWIQDHLSNLTNTKAGASVGPWDYVLSFAGPMFIRSHGYPAGRMIDVPMMFAALTPPPPPPPGEGEHGSRGTRRVEVDDLVYVSNVSGRPAEIVPGVLEGCEGMLGEVVSEVAQVIIKTYERGGAIATLVGIKRLLDEASGSRGLRMVAEVRNVVADRLWGQLNSALYRQQALTWVADAADALGLRLGVYGRGWEKHPRFGGYARGVVTHGPELAELMHRARINLCLEPYTCFAHHRLLDGLMSDAFFLVRDHPSHVWLPRLSALLAELGEGTEAAQDAAGALAGAGAEKQALKQVLTACQDLTYDPDVDPVVWVRAWERAGLLRGAEIALPDLAEVSFADAASCRRKVEHFLAHPDKRRAIGQRQRQSVADRLTFDAGLRRAFAVIADRLAEQAASEERANRVQSDTSG